MKDKKRRSIFGRMQRTPKWKKEEFSEIEYEPTSVKELLTEMKDISELIIDLAYSAVLFDNEEIAEEVKYLEVRMDKLNYDIRMMAMMAARTKEDAEQLAGTRPILPKILRKADEGLFRIKVSSDSKACEQKIGDLKIESETGMRIIAIRREDCWIYNPRSDSNIKADDWLITRGTNEGYADLSKFLKGELEVLE